MYFLRWLVRLDVPRVYKRIISNLQTTGYCNYGNKGGVENNIDNSICYHRLIIYSIKLVKKKKRKERKGKERKKEKKRKKRKEKKRKEKKRKEKKSIK